MHDPGDTLLDGRISDFLDTHGEEGRALVAASSVADSPNVVGVLLWADGCILNRLTELDTLYCDELMGEPEGPGFWVWEGCLRIDGFDGFESYEGTWRQASPMELALYQEGLTPFREAARA